eukprot:TRINITY_DN49012_c0_g1_i1.p1 TRINITY_DN49012_c0_g1~~TRINITY_DN49012_c0_g1_i1.p1  ORF type:complete len:187 (+),score=36.66 TRINITY_DN49012_c0_g1_i1:100-660(+)
MSWCERRLSEHVDCVKQALRQARTDGTPYTPGTYNEFDKCGGTRQEYVNCSHGPKQKVEKKVLNQISSQAQPLDFYSQRSKVGPASKEEGNPTLLGSKPPACQMELNLHGKCVENYLRNSTSKGTGYIFLGVEGEDRCFNTRTSFDKCLRGTMDLAEGKKPEPDWAPWKSLNLSKNFSILGHWSHD